MPRQKLPKGWKWDQQGNAETVDDSDENRNWFEVYGAGVGTMEKCGDSNTDVPAVVALAVIRNAGLDPLLDMAKRVVAEPMVTIEERLMELKKLIESMEEP